MSALQTKAIYEVELCSGERCRWQYLGADENGAIWWRDDASGREFNEGSLMYAWKIVAPVNSTGAL